MDQQIKSKQRVACQAGNGAHRQHIYGTSLWHWKLFGGNLAAKAGSGKT